MKTLRIACLAGMLCMMTSAAMVAQKVNAQTTAKVDVTLSITGVHAGGGKLMASAVDPKDSKHTVYAMADPTADELQAIVLENVPVGMCDIYVFQDMNGNMTLDRNADGVPTEPCYMKQKVKVADHGVLLKARLVNPAEMMGK